MLNFKSFDNQPITYFIHSKPEQINNSIIVVHGFGGDLSLIKEFINNLTTLKNTQVISYELRGHASSSNHFSDIFTFFEEAHTLDLKSLIDHLNIHNPILIGHSLGGIIIQDYLNKHLQPSPIQIFLVCSTTSIHGLKFFRKFFYKIISRLPESKSRFKAKSPEFYQKFRTTWDIDVFRFIHDTTVVGGFIRWLLYILALSGWRNKNLNLLNNNNYFYIYGKKDIIVSTLLQKLKIKNLNKINKIEMNAGHIVPITQPEELASIVKEHIKT